MKKIVWILGIMFIVALLSGPALADQPAHTEEKKQAFERPSKRMAKTTRALIL